MEPNSQKDRPIGFVLWDDEASEKIADHWLVIRPEEMTKSDPSRGSVQQTLGGAWLDDFGTGLSNITIKGHTGWRGTDSLSGESLWTDLHGVVLARYHAERATRVAQGRDPDRVQLLFADQLNDLSLVVYPERFSLHRHKSRPLLKLFDISLIVLGDVSFDIRFTDPIQRAIDNPLGRYGVAGERLKSASDKMRGLAEKSKAFFGPLTNTMSEVMNLTADGLDAVNKYADTVTGGFDAVTGPVLQTSIMLQRAGHNVCQILATPANLATHVKAGLMEISANYNETICLLMNNFNLLRELPVFDDLFGASNCSSTGGGLPPSPLADRNAFDEFYSPRKAPVSVSRDASSALASLGGDPLSMTSMTATQLERPLTTIKDGVRFS